MKRLALIMAGICLLFILGACGAATEDDEETVSGAEGTMPAGEELPETIGVLKSMESAEKVIISVDGEDVIYRLSADAIDQIENEEVDYDTEVTFTTYSIGDDMETIDRFISE